MSALFVTGTDTGVGKTLVCGLLGRYLLDQGHKAITQKWIQTGAVGSSCDINRHLRLMQLPRESVKAHLPHMSPYNFKFASSAHLASRLEKKKISSKKIKQSFEYLTRKFDFVVVEGMGGALVPFNQRSLLLDIVSELDLPLLVVAANKLGAINHTLLTIEALKRRRLKVLGLVFNNHSRGADKTILKDNPRIISALTGEKVLGILPGAKDNARLHQAFSPIGKKIFSSLKKEY